MRIQHENDDSAITVRTSAHAVFELNSADRNVTGAGLSPSTYSPGVGTYGDAQRWNNFTLSKAQPMLDSFARRIGVTEVNFPWYIPNINLTNNVQVVQFLAPSPIVGNLAITVPPGFYTGTQLANDINDQFLADAGGILANQQITATWDAANNRMRYTPNVVGGVYVKFKIIPKYGTYAEQVSNPSLDNTLGFSWPYLNTEFSADPALNLPKYLLGSGTNLRYTDYVDICSERLHYDQEARDGISNEKTYRDILCRIYCANDTSTYTQDPPGTRPFNIHRQFKTPKMLKVNPQQFIPNVDIQVLDQYGNLCYIPPQTDVEVSPGVKVNTTSVFPDFQLTFIASEN